MEDFANRYGNHFIKLTDRVTMKEFEFDQILLMPTAGSYRALVEQAKVEMKPKIMRILSKKWSAETIENLSFFAMAVAVYARSVANPPYKIDVGKVLLRTLAFCNLRCSHGKGTGGGCMAAMNKGDHHLPKCIKIPKDINFVWGCMKNYIATGKTITSHKDISIKEAMSVEVDPGSDFAPATSC